MARDLDAGRFLLPNPITVTLRRPAGRLAPETAAVVSRVQEQPVTQDDADHPLGGALDGAWRTFHLWRVECGGLIPYHDYEIQRADGTIWVIKKIETLAHGRRFRCHCQQRNDTSNTPFTS